MRKVFLLAGALLLATAGAAHAQGAPSASLIYTCIDANGKKLTRDRYIAECSAREQRVLNSDGSLRQLLPPTLTGEERSNQEEAVRRADAEQVRAREAIKRDQLLLVRFPNEDAHRKARELALENVRASLRTSDQRLAALAKERKPLMNEAEFYVGKPLPFKLKLALDANDASVDAQKVLQQNQQQELVRIDRNYDEELDRLRKLWAGAKPGSIGALASAPPPSATHR